jgi:hypothetical protein
MSVCCSHLPRILRFKKEELELELERKEAEKQLELEGIK